MKQLLIRLLKAPVYAYRYLISPLLGPRCRFTPTCSEYCLQALEKHGPFRGLWLTGRRLLRCHPWSGQAGFDPVPDAASTNNTTTKE